MRDHSLLTDVGTDDKTGLIEAITPTVARVPLALVPRMLRRIRHLEVTLQDRLSDHPGEHTLGLATMRGTAGPQPDLAVLLGSSERVSEVSRERVPILLAQLAALQTALAARLIASRDENDAASNGAAPDRLVAAQEAAQMLAMSPDYLYRNSKKLPFTVRPTPGSLRFSVEGIARFIRQRRGR